MGNDEDLGKTDVVVEETADTMQIISKLWLLSTRTENIELLIDQSEDLWSPEEKIFLIHLPDRTLKCNAFYSKIIQRDDPIDKVKLLKALRASNNDFIADEISSENHSSVRQPSASQTTEAEESTLTTPLEVPENELSTLSTLKMDDSFTSVQLIPPSKTRQSSQLTSVEYEVNGTRLKKSSNLLDFGFKSSPSVEKIVEPRGLFVSESYYQKITTLKLSNFIIHQSHLIQALQPCDVIQVLEMKNVFFDSNITSSSSTTTIINTTAATKLWLPKLKKFIFHADKLVSSINVQHSTEGYTWDWIFFFETNKGNPVNLRNLWQSQTVDVSVRTLSMEVEIVQPTASVLFRLLRRQWNGVPILPDFFFDDFFMNCRRVQNLEITLPEVCARLDFNSLPDELRDVRLSGFMIVGSFSSIKPIQTLLLSNCILPGIFLSELCAILPLSKCIQLLNCVQENVLGTSATNPNLINIKITSS